MRQEIAERIVTCDALQGKSYADVVRLLGAPDERGEDPLAASYWIGEERGVVKLDSEYLDVTFGPGGRVRAVEITGS